MPGILLVLKSYSSADLEKAHGKIIFFYVCMMEKSHRQE